MSQLIGRGAHGFLCAVTPIGLPIAHRQVTAVVLLDSEAKRLFMATQEVECDPAHVEEPTTEVNTQENDQKEEAKIIAEEMQKRDLSKVYVSNLSNYMTQKELAAFLNEHHVEGVKWVFRVFGDASVCEEAERQDVWVRDIQLAGGERGGKGVAGDVEVR